jgi:methyl-accepting chemotaxis protein
MVNNKFLLVVERSSNELSFNRESSGEYILEGVFGEIGVKNKNNRIYDESEYVPQIKALQEKIKSGKLLGELDHPSNFDISLKNASHVIENLEYDNTTRQVKGRIRLLNTTAGREAKALVDAGIPIHISSRAAGVVENNGHVKIKKLFTYDLVADPGFENAELKRVNESYGIADDENISIFELPSNYNFDKYNITENNYSNMSEYIKNEDFNKYTQYLAGEFSKIHEQIKSIKESSNNDANEGVVRYAEHIAEKVNQLHAYTNFLAENLDNTISHSDHIVEGFNNMEKYMNYVAEKADQGIQYTESVAEKVDQSIQYSEYIAEKSESIIEFANYISENMDKLASHNDYLTEGLNSVVKFADYLKENLETVGNYSNYVGENLDKLNKRLTGVNENVSTSSSKSEISNLNEYKTSITEKLQLLIESAKKQTAVNGDNVQAINESNGMITKSAVDNTPVFIKQMPVEYKPLWENLSISRKNEILAESKRYDLSTQYQITNFWQTRDLRNRQIVIERINESKAAVTEEVKQYAVNNNYLENFKGQLESRFAKYSK